MGKPVSVVIPAYRAAATIALPINAVISSVGVNAEIIVVEDGAYDDLRKVISGFPNVRLITNKRNLGAAAARNMGLAHVSTPYVIFLDADDYVDSSLLAHLREELCRSGAGVAFGPWRFVYNSQPNPVLHKPQPSDHSTMVAKWLRNNCIPTCSVMWATDAVRRIGGWNTAMTYNDDAELVFRALVNGTQFAVTQLGCGYYVQHNSPYRVSRASIAVTSAAALVIFEMVERWLQASHANSAVVRPAMAEFAYEQARIAYRQGVQPLGNAWLDRSRTFGLRHHPGSFLHQFLSNILGLSAKERLASLRDKLPLLHHRFE
jgi:glycosyltransferase involved in cell wall biosynthesis